MNRTVGSAFLGAGFFAIDFLAIGFFDARFALDALDAWRLRAVGFRFGRSPVFAAGDVRVCRPFATIVRFFLAAPAFLTLPTSAPRLMLPLQRNFGVCSVAIM